MQGRLGASAAGSTDRMLHAAVARMGQRSQINLLIARRKS